MSSPSDAAPDRSPAAGEETKSRLSRKRVTVITATALSLLEACGLEPSPSRSEKTAGKGKKAAQDAAPAGKAPADDREKKQAADPASSRSRNTSRKKTPPSGKISRTDAGNLPEEDASLAFASGNVPEVPPVVPSDGAAPVAATPPGPVVPPKKTSARRRRAAGTKTASVPGGGASFPLEAGEQGTAPVAGPALGKPSVAASVPGEEPPLPTTGRRAAPRAGRPSTPGGRGRKKAVEISSALAAEAVPTVASEQQGPARPMDAAALAAEADRLAAEYGLSSSGGGLVVLPGDDDWDDFPAPRAAAAPSPQTAARSAVTTPVAPCPEPAPAEARSVVGGSSSVPAPEPGPAVKSASRRRAARTKEASVPGGGARPAAQAGTSLSDAGSGDGEAYAPVRSGAAPVAAGPSGSTPPSGAGMGKREAAFRQWAADMQARFDAGLEAEEDRAARRKDMLVVLPPPTDTGGRKRRTAKKPQAAAAEAPRPRAWITRRRSTEPGHEARFEEWHGPARTGSVLEKVFISLGASPEQAKLSRLWRSWDAVLGPDLAPLARPLGHHDDRLLIGAEDAVLLQELYYMGPEIVRRVNEFLQEDFFSAVKVSLMLDHQDLDAPSPVLERSAGRPKEELPAPSGASLGLMDSESAVARCYARFLGMELPDPRK